MTEDNDEEITELLKAVISPVDRGLQRDLWTAMLNRMHMAEPGLSWYDWALIAGLCGWAFVYPQGILQLLYQL
jgi:hypothetical protein